MFNIVGILLALLISGAARGSGLIVGWESVVAVAVAIAAVLVFSRVVAAHVVDGWQLNKLRIAALPADPPPGLRESIHAEREMILRRLPLLRHGVDALIIASFGATAWIFGWTDFVSDHLHVPMYLDVLPHLAPYFAMLGASWWGQYRIEREVRGTDWRPGKFLGFQVRANGMTILPIALIYAVYWGITNGVPGLEDLRKSFAFLDVALQLGLVVGVSLMIPFAIRMILPGGPLPEGRLRRKLEGFARDRGLRINQILVWRTGSRMFATAFVIGLISPFRYVFITDSLMRRLNEDEILAVFAHELGHVKHRHLWWLLAFILSFTVLLLALAYGAALLMPATTQMLPGVNTELIATGVLLVYGYFMFGYISRRFERQADAFAAEHTSPELLSQVFLKLGMDNPTAMQKHGWRHFSLDRRIRELIVTRAHPEVRKLFNAQLWRGLALGVVVTIGACFLLIEPVREDVVTGLATYSLTKFDQARVEDADPEKLEKLRERTIERSRAMGELSVEYKAIALWYVGVVEGLSGNNPDGLDEYATLARARQADATTSKEKAAWDRELQKLEATRVAIQKARENDSLFDTEFDTELERRGLKTGP